MGWLDESHPFFLGAGLRLNLRNGFWGGLYNGKSDPRGRQECRRYEGLNSKTKQAIRDAVELADRLGRRSLRRQEEPKRAALRDSGQAGCRGYKGKGSARGRDEGVGRAAMKGGGRNW